MSENAPWLLNQMAERPEPDHAWYATEEKSDGTLVLQRASCLCGNVTMWYRDMDFVKLNQKRHEEMVRGGI